jgi:hypothetical protein
VDRTREDLEVTDAEPVKWERVKDARGSDMCRCDAARPKRARVQQQEEEEQLHGVQDDGVQGGHARCGRSCSVAATGESAREQRGHAWRTSEAIEVKATEGTALMPTDLGPRGGRRTVMARRAGKKGGKAEVATGCNELGGATHGELRSSMRRSEQE